MKLLTMSRRKPQPTTLPIAADSPCFVYAFITQQVEGDVFVKVGFSTRPVLRIVAIMTGCPLRLVRMRAIETPNKKIARNMEGSMHSALDKYRVSGEWFRMAPDLAELDAAFKSHSAGRGWADAEIDLTDMAAVRRADMDADREAREAKLRAMINKDRMARNFAPI